MAESNQNRPVQGHNVIDDAIPSTSGLQKTNRRCLSLTPEDSSNSGSSFSVHDSSDNDTGLESEQDNEECQLRESFTDMLKTPDAAVVKATKSVRKPAINSRAQIVKKDLFDKQEKPITPKIHKTASLNKRSLKKQSLDLSENSGSGSKITPKAPPKSRQTKIKESWYCKLCQEDRVADMRVCVACNVYMHEECLGLTAKDKIPNFLCPECDQNT
ncbi:hypothetical protein PPYR_01844 [Photinus pyralis]|uniref:Zinc finger PHD-type domain-containing protein n=2 Tax=Photinus pyralis TaxID=7054 RepID=A0A5N4B5P7_PHOPY|nr:hypothetical protein PPYR_01844 [Photinus pyralis]